ncbi:MAG: hypothetical protein MUF06_06495 [Pirellulaceae bacterium]|nr:hypothetical protein [Pirellulaceae bacterium]
MRHSFRWLVVVPALLALASGVALPSMGRAADPVAAEGELVESAADAVRVDPAQWIKQLESAEFSERQEASRKLAEAGREAFEALESAAKDGSREVISRAIEILRRHHEGGEDATREAATAALNRLAGSSHSSAAKQAREALDPPKEPEGIPLNAALPAVRPAIRLQIGAIQRAGLPAGNIRRTHVRSINGKREIEVQDGDKITKVKELEGDALEAEITEKVNGKETTRKIAAKNLDDLKKQDEAAAKIYEQHAGRGAAAPRGGFAPGAIPAQLGKQQLEQIDKMIEQMKQQQAGNPALPRLIESLERHREQIKQRLPVEGQQEAAPAAAPPQAAAPADAAKADAARQAAETAAADAVRALEKAAQAAAEAAEAAKAAAEAQP